MQGELEQAPGHSRAPNFSLAELSQRHWVLTHTHFQLQLCRRRGWSLETGIATKLGQYSVGPSPALSHMAMLPFHSQMKDKNYATGHMETNITIKILSSVMEIGPRGRDLQVQPGSQPVFPIEVSR